MKKFAKILSSVLAVSMIVSCFAINAFAARQDRTYTIKTDKAGVALKAGDVVTVEVVADTLLHAANAGYYVYFDPEVFTIDTAAGGMGKPKKYIDTTWYQTMNAADQVVGWYWGTVRTANESAADGWIMCSWGGNTDAGAGVEAENNQTNYTIGKYYLTVKADAPAGNTQITVDGETFGWQENSADSMTYVPATLTVGAAAPTTKAVGLVATLKYDNTKTGVAFTVTDTVADLTSAPYQVSYAALAETTIENLAAITVGLEVTEVPEDSELTATAELY